MIRYSVFIAGIICSITYLQVSNAVDNSSSYAKDFFLSDNKQRVLIKISSLFCRLPGKQYFGGTGVGVLHFTAIGTSTLTVFTSTAGSVGTVVQAARDNTLKIINSLFFSIIQLLVDKVDRRIAGWCILGRLSCKQCIRLFFNFSSLSTSCC